MSASPRHEHDLPICCNTVLAVKFATQRHDLQDFRRSLGTDAVGTAVAHISNRYL